MIDVLMFYSIVFYSIVFYCIGEEAILVPGSLAPNFVKGVGVTKSIQQSADWG